MSESILAEFLQQGVELLKEEDPALHALLEREHYRQLHTLTLVAASSIADPSVFACSGATIGNLTTEGYPAKRFHGGCAIADEIERLAIERAKAAFSADDNMINYNEVRQLACQTKPRLIVAGASAYPRHIDFQQFRAIADEVGAFLLADISHIAGLVVAGEHQNPVNYAHFTTTSTYKQLYGPRGGLILMGKDHDMLAPDGKSTLADRIQKSTFPFFQGTPSLNAIAAKARALGMVMTPAFTLLAKRVVANAKMLASVLVNQGYDVLTGGTDNHMVLLNMATNGMTGVVAEKALEECDIIVNKNRIPGDSKAALVTSGLRLGTNSATARGMGAGEMMICAELIHRVLSSIVIIDDRSYGLNDAVKREARGEVESLCSCFPIPRYPSERTRDSGVRRA